MNYYSCIVKAIVWILTAVTVPIRIYYTQNALCLCAF
nr:MAG TPA: hypothetical protein [Caudoviricetes sp.]